MQDVHDLSLIIHSRVPIIVLETHDEQRALELLTRVALKQQLGFYCWSVTDGLNRFGFGDDIKAAGGPESPTEVLKAIKTRVDTAIYALCDFHPFLHNQPETIRHLKDIAIRHERVAHTLVLISHELTIPPELTRYCARFTMRLPNDAQLAAIVREEASSWSKENLGLRLKTDHGTLKKLVKNLRGLSQRDARRVVRIAIRDDGAITEDDLPQVNQAKYELLGMDGLLSFEYDTEKFSAVGGLTRLKAWLEKRQAIFLQKDGSCGDRPKGVMLLGVQGSGKSLAAKAVAGLWSIPLLRLDMAALYNKYIGETEKNLRHALAQAEVMQPCVLWMDEIEKALATGDSDDGTSRRVMGSLLTWLAERKSQVFIVATANDVTQLPPELLRKGRFDEIFFVDLPEQAVREQIFAIHLQKRNFDPVNFNLAALAEQALGFSGAEIEQAIVAALYSALAQRVPLTAEHIEAEIDSTAPLSVVMAEKVEALRAWAQGRTVPAE